MQNNPLESTITTSLDQGDLLWLVWYIAAFIFAVHAIIIIYHWFTYGTTKRVPMIAATIYVAVGVCLLAAAGGVLYFYI